MSYGKVHDVFWDDDKIESIPDRAALLGLFLITGPHRNAIGCFKLGLGAITDNPRFQKWGIEGVSDALSELSEIGFTVRDDRTGWTFITNALKHDPIKGPKAAVHAAKLALSVPTSLQVYQALRERLEPQLKTEMKGIDAAPGWPMRESNVTHPIPHHIPNRSPEPSPDPFPNPEPAPAPAAAASDENQIEGQEAKRICEAFNSEVETIFTSRTHVPHTTNYHTALVMVRDGYTAEFCRPVFVAVLTRMCTAGKEPPNALSYFRKPLADARAAIGTPMPKGTARTGAASETPDPAKAAEAFVWAITKGVHGRSDPSTAQVVALVKAGRVTIQQGADYCRERVETFTVNNGLGEQTDDDLAAACPQHLRGAA